MKESAMAAMGGCNEADERVLLDGSREEHRIRDKRIVLGRDDCRGHGDPIQHMPCSRTIVVVGSVSIASVGSRISIVKFADARDALQPSKIPFPLDEGGLAP